MSTTAVGKAIVADLDADDQALYARFRVEDAEARFDWPDDKELSGKNGKKDVKRRRKNRDARNFAAIESLQDPYPPYRRQTQETNPSARYPCQ